MFLWMGICRIPIQKNNVFWEKFPVFMLLVTGSLPASGWGSSGIIKYLSGWGQLGYCPLFHNSSSPSSSPFASVQANLVGFSLLAYGKRSFQIQNPGTDTKQVKYIWLLLWSALSPQSKDFVVTWWLANLLHVLCWLAIPSYKEWSHLLNVTKTVVFIHARSELSTVQGQNDRTRRGEQWTNWSSAIYKRFGE